MYVETKDSISRTFEKQFALPKKTFLAGFFSLFGGNNSFQDSIQRIYELKAGEALTMDLYRLGQDYCRAIEKHRKELPPVEKKELT